MTTFSFYSQAASLDLSCFNPLKPQSDKIVITVTESSAFINQTEFQKEPAQDYQGKIYYTAMEGQLELLINTKLISGELWTAQTYLIQNKSNLTNYRCSTPGH